MFRYWYAATGISRKSDNCFSQNIEELGSLKRSVSVYESKRRNVASDLNLSHLYCDNLKFVTQKPVIFSSSTPVRKELRLRQLSATKHLDLRNYVF